MEALAKPRPKSAVKHTVANKSHKFASTIQYEARIGYGPDISIPSDNVNLQWTKVSPPISYVPKMLPVEDIVTSSKDETAALVTTGTHPSDTPEDLSAEVDSEEEEAQQEPTGLEKIVDEIAYKFWDCGRCLSMGHVISDCTREIRCRNCYRYGHIARSCLNRFSKSAKKWVPKKLKAPTRNESGESTTRALTVSVLTTFNHIGQKLGVPVETLFFTALSTDTSPTYL
jgi:hypothetical protein